MESYGVHRAVKIMTAALGVLVVREVEMFQVDLEADAAKYGSLHRKSDAGTDLVDNEKLFCSYQ